MGAGVEGAVGPGSFAHELRARARSREHGICAPARVRACCTVLWAAIGRCVRAPGSLGASNRPSSASSHASHCI